MVYEIMLNFKLDKTPQTPYVWMTQGTIEEKIYQRQTAKQGLSGTVADAKETVKIEFSREELKVSTVTSCINAKAFNFSFQSKIKVKCCVHSSKWNKPVGSLRPVLGSGFCSMKRTEAVLALGWDVNPSLGYPTPSLSQWSAKRWAIGTMWSEVRCLRKQHNMMQR